MMGGCGSRILDAAAAVPASHDVQCHLSRHRVEGQRLGPPARTIQAVGQAQARPHADGAAPIQHPLAYCQGFTPGSLRLLAVHKGDQPAIDGQLARAIHRGDQPAIDGQLVSQ